MANALSHLCPSLSMLRQSTASNGNALCVAQALLVYSETPAVGPAPNARDCWTCSELGSLHLLLPLSLLTDLSSSGARSLKPGQV